MCDLVTIRCDRTFFMVDHNFFHRIEEKIRSLFEKCRLVLFVLGKYIVKACFSAEKKWKKIASVFRFGLKLF